MRRRTRGAAGGAARRAPGHAAGHVTGHTAGEAAGHTAGPAVTTGVVVACSGGLALVLLAASVVVPVVGTAVGEGGAPPVEATWADDFDGPAGSPPDAAAWTAQTGSGGWGNDELQTYTADAAVLDGDGHLVITATIGADGQATSGRITTQTKRSFGAGTVAARIRLPDGTGLLPAFWLLGDSVETIGWPAAGEVDVVETPFSTGTSTHLLHGGTLNAPTTDAQAGGDAVHDVPLSGDFHVFAVTRSADAVTWTIDDEVVQRVDRASAPDGLRWVFTQPFHVLFSLAVGGRWPGSPDETTPVESRMVVDWVRATEG